MISHYYRFDEGAICGRKFVQHLTSDIDKTTCKGCRNKMRRLGLIRPEVNTVIMKIPLKEVNIPFPRKLKSDEIIAIELNVDGKWRFRSAFGPGCEHDAHGVAVVRKRMNPEHGYRLKIYKRIKS